MQLRALGLVLSQLSGGETLPSTFIWLIALFLFAYCVIGGMRAVGYLGSLQAALLGLAIFGLGIAVIVSTSGFVALNQQLATLAQGDQMLARRLFEVSGVDRKSTRLNASTEIPPRMPSSA